MEDGLTCRIECEFQHSVLFTTGSHSTPGRLLTQEQPCCNKTLCHLKISERLSVILLHNGIELAQVEEPGGFMRSCWIGLPYKLILHGVTVAQRTGVSTPLQLRRIRVRKFIVIVGVRAQEIRGAQSSGGDLARNLCVNST